MSAEGRLVEVAAGLRSRTTVVGRSVPRPALADRMAELHVPAVSIAVLENGRVSARSLGELAADTETLFQAASISKPVTALAAMRLAADGVLDLDRNVNEMLNDWQLPDDEGVTVRRILSHSAGLSVHGFPGYAADGPVPSTAQVLDGEDPANTEPVRVVRPPGSEVVYSGGGFTILQQVLEDETGESFPALMRRTVLDPLGMHASAFAQPLPELLRSQASCGHDPQGEQLAGCWRIHPEMAAAGLWTHPVELVRAAAEMIGPGAVLDERSRNEMLRERPGDPYGLGWARYDGATTGDGDAVATGSGWFGHGGSNEGFRAQLLGSVEHRVAVAVMANGDGGGAICSDVCATVAEVFGWSGYLKERTVIELSDERLNEIAGDYEIAPEFVVSIRRVGDTLMSSGPGLPDAELYASTPTTLFRTDIDADITWTTNELTIGTGASPITARRKTT